MISFDDFDIEEKPSSDIHKVLEHIHHFSYGGKYSYNGYRYCLYNELGSNYLGHGKWDTILIYLGGTEISDDEKDLIRKDKILITTHYNYNSGLFRWWNIEELVNDLKRYSPEFLK